MKTEFWLQRWSENKIGFHLDEVNPYLVEHWPVLNIAKGERVFVPMCGKSVDMRWLIEQGYLVEAIEISALAIEAFFSEQEMVYQRQSQGEWVVYEAESIRIWCGDYFQLSTTQFNSMPADSSPYRHQIAAIYDRAALIAMPSEMRPKYLHHLMELTGPTPQLLITLDYAQAQMSGPPFAVSHDEVVGFYHDYFEIDKIITTRTDVLPEHSHFADRGLTSLFECAYLLQVPKI